MPEELEYEEQLAVFEKLVRNGIKVSDRSSAVTADVAGVEATKIFTRLTLSSMTINAILPQNTVNGHLMWDYSSLAVLTRVFLETTHRYLYLAEKNLTPDEAGFRLKLHFYRMNLERSKLNRDAGRSDEFNSEFDEKIPIAKHEIMNNPVYENLGKDMKYRIRKGQVDMHLTDEEVAEKFNLVISGWFKPYYRTLSNHSHGSPMSTTSQSNTRGRGMQNDVEKSLSTIALFVLNRYISKATVFQVQLLELQNSCDDVEQYASRILG